jgi:hypothetical protein
MHLECMLEDDLRCVYVGLPNRAMIHQTVRQEHNVPSDSTSRYVIWNSILTVCLSHGYYQMPGTSSVRQ